MTKALTSARRATLTVQRNHLDQLVDRIAVGDRTAFRCLYAFMAMPVWRAALAALPHQLDATAATRSTFLELWHLTRNHATAPRSGTAAWLAMITAVRIDERLRILNPSCPLLGDHDRHVHHELVSLLGTGRATIRISPATFSRVDDLDLALATIAIA